MKSIAAAGSGLLLLLTLGEGVSRGGACAGPEHYAVIGVDGGRALQLNRRVTVRYGLDFRHRGGWPDCRARVTPASATAELSRSRTRRGPWTRIARGSGRKAFWTPTGLGLWWLRAQAKDRYGQLHTRLGGVFVGNGTVKLPVTKYRYTRAQLWADGRGTDVVVELQAGRIGPMALPRAAGWWLLSARGRLAWARVSATSKVRVTRAPAALRLRIGDVTRRGWQVWIHHPGMPRIPQPCKRECALQYLPAGKVELRVRPVAKGETPRSVPLQLRAGRKNRSSVSAMHLLARKPQPAQGGWSLFKSPALRVAPSKNACRNARPFDGPKGPAAISRALCGRAKAGTAWVPRVAPPGYLARGRATVPKVHGEHTVWVENAARIRNLDDRVLLYVATTAGMIVERVPLLDTGRASDLAVARNGDVWVVGRTGYSHSRTGFAAVRGKLGWKVHLRSAPILAVAAHSSGALALDAWGLTRCVKRCRSGPRAAEQLTTFVTTRQGLRVAAQSGALYAIHGQRLRRTLAKPTFGFPLTRVVTTKHGSFGLFGPVTAGSEYHPYCVASVVARLTRTGWKEVHRVGGKTGRRLDCQNDDRSPPVVMDIAAAGRAIYARLRARNAGLLPGFRLIYSIPKP
ncbi:MAG: hypothetical protein ABI333_00685 [bacterium]